MGKRKLAYEIKKQKEGFYIVFKFEAKPELISELERNYRITDEVMKFIVDKRRSINRNFKEEQYMNKVILMGRLTRNSEVRYTTNTNTLVASFSFSSK